jgi:hypothetical protein
MYENTMMKPTKNKKRWAGGVAQVIEHLPSKCDLGDKTPEFPKTKKGRRDNKKTVLKEVIKVHYMCVCTYHNETPLDIDIC